MTLPMTTHDNWIPGPPTASGYYWIVQVAQGGCAFGPGLVFVYDGYPDGLQPPVSCRTGNPDYVEWVEKTKEWTGKQFLRVRCVSPSFDKELCRLPVDFHVCVAIPVLP